MAGGLGTPGSGLSVSLIADVEKAVRDITVTADTVISKLNEVKFAAQRASKSIAESYKQVNQSLQQAGGGTKDLLRGTGKLKSSLTDMAKTGLTRIFDPTGETQNLEKIQNAWSKFTKSRPMQELKAYRAQQKLLMQEAYAQKYMPHQIPAIPVGMRPGDEGYEILRQQQLEFYRGVRVPGVFKQALTGAVDDIRGIDVPELMFGGLRDLGQYFGMVASWVGRVRVLFQSLGGVLMNVLTSPIRVLQKSTDWIHNIFTAMFKTFQWFQYQLFMQFMNFWLLTKTIFPVLETFLDYNREIYQTWSLIGDTWGHALDRFMDSASGISFDVFSGLFAGAGEYAEEELGVMYDTTQRILSDIGQDVGTWLSAIGLEAAREFGKIPQDVAEALYLIASAGIAFEDVIPTLDSVAKAAVAGASSIEEATQAGIAAAYAFGIEMSQLDEILNLQFLTIRYGILRYEDLTKVMGRVYQPAASLSDTMENLAEVYATMAFATRMGLGPEMAAFGMARLFEALSRAQVVSNLRDIGVHVYDTTGYFRGLYDVVGQLAGALRGLTTETQQKMLSTMGFDMRAIRVLRSLITNFTEYSNLMGVYMEDAFGAEKATEAMETAYNRMREAYSFTVDQLKASWDALKVEAVQHTIETLIYFVDKLNSLLRVMVGVFRSASEEIGNTGANLADWLKYVGIIYGVFALIATLSGVLKTIISPIGLVTAGFVYLVQQVRHAELPIRYLMEQFPLLANVIMVTSKYLDVFRQLMQDRAPISHFAKATAMMVEELFNALSAYPSLANILTAIKDMGRALRAVFDPYQEQQVMLDFFAETGAQAGDIFDVITYRYGQIFRAVGQALKTFLQRAFRLDAEDTGEVIRQSIGRLYSMIMSTFAAIFDEPPDTFSLYRLVGRTLETLGIVVQTSFGHFRLAPAVMQTVADFFIGIISGAINLMLSNVDVLFALAGFKLMTAFMASFGRHLSAAVSWMAGFDALAPALGLATLKFYAIIEIIDVLLGRKVSEFLEDIFGSQLMAIVVKALMGAMVAVMAIAPLRKLWLSMFDVTAFKALFAKTAVTAGATMFHGGWAGLNLGGMLTSIKLFISTLFTKIFAPIFGKGGFLWKMLAGIGIGSWIGPGVITGVTGIKKTVEERQEVYEAQVAALPKVVTPFGIALRELSRPLQEVTGATRDWKGALISLGISLAAFGVAVAVPAGIPIVGFIAKLVGFSKLWEGLFSLVPSLEGLDFWQLAEAIEQQQTDLITAMHDSIRDPRLRGVFKDLSERFMDTAEKVFVTAIKDELPSKSLFPAEAITQTFELLSEIPELASLIQRIEIPDIGQRFLILEEDWDSIAKFLTRLAEDMEVYPIRDRAFFDIHQQLDAIWAKAEFPTAPIRGLIEYYEDFFLSFSEIGIVTSNVLRNLLIRVESLAGYVSKEEFDSLVAQIVSFGNTVAEGFGEGNEAIKGVLDDLDKQVSNMEATVGKINFRYIAGAAMRELNELVFRDYLSGLAEILSPEDLKRRLHVSLSTAYPGISFMDATEGLGKTIADFLDVGDVDSALNEIVKAITSVDASLSEEGIRWGKALMATMTDFADSIYSWDDIFAIHYAWAKMVIASRGAGEGNTEFQRLTSEFMLGMLNFAEGNFKLVERLLGFLDVVDAKEIPLEQLADEFRKHMDEMFEELFKPTVGEILGVRMANALLDTVREAEFDFSIGEIQIFDPLKGTLYPGSAMHEQFVDPLNTFIREYLGRFMEESIETLASGDAIFGAMSRVFKLDTMSEDVKKEAEVLLNEIAEGIASDIVDSPISEVIDNYYEQIKQTLGSDSEMVRLFENLGKQFIELETLLRGPTAIETLKAFHKIDNIEELLDMFTKVGLANDEAAKQLLESWKTIVNEIDKITEQIVQAGNAVTRGLAGLSDLYSDREAVATFEIYMKLFGAFFSPIQMLGSILEDMLEASMSPMKMWDTELSQLYTLTQMQAWYEENAALLYQVGLLSQEQMLQIAGSSVGLQTYINELRSLGISFADLSTYLQNYFKVLMEIEKLKDPYRERDITKMTASEMISFGKNIYNNFAALISAISSVFLDPALWDALLKSPAGWTDIITEIGEGISERFWEALYLPYDEFMKNLQQYGFRTQEFASTERMKLWKDALEGSEEAFEAFDLAVEDINFWAEMLSDLTYGFTIETPPSPEAMFGGLSIKMPSSPEAMFGTLSLDSGQSEQELFKFQEFVENTYTNWFDRLIRKVVEFFTPIAEQGIEIGGVALRFPIISGIMSMISNYTTKIIDGMLKQVTAAITTGTFGLLMGTAEEPGTFAAFFRDVELLDDNEIRSLVLAISADIGRFSFLIMSAGIDFVLGRWERATDTLSSLLIFDEGSIVDVNWEALIPATLGFFRRLDQTIMAETVAHYVDFFSGMEWAQDLQAALDKYETGEIFSDDLQRVFSDQWNELRRFVGEFITEHVAQPFLAGLLRGFANAAFWVVERFGLHEMALTGITRAFSKEGAAQGLYFTAGTGAEQYLAKNLPVQDWSVEVWDMIITGLVTTGEYNLNEIRKHILTFGMEAGQLRDTEIVDKHLREVTDEIYDFFTTDLAKLILPEPALDENIYKQLNEYNAAIKEYEDMIEVGFTVGQLVALLHVATLEGTIFDQEVIDEFLDLLTPDVGDFPASAQAIADLYKEYEKEFDALKKIQFEVTRVMSLTEGAVFGDIMKEMIARAAEVPYAKDLDFEKLLVELDPEQRRELIDTFNERIGQVITAVNNVGSQLVSIADGLEELDWGSEEFRNSVKFVGLAIQHLVEAVNVMVAAQTLSGILGLGDVTKWIALAVGLIAVVINAIVDWKRIFGASQEITEANTNAIQSNTTAITQLTNILDSLQNVLYNAPAAFAYGYAIPGFSAGGETAGNPGDIAGVVHGGEWVAPAWMVNHGVYGDQIRALEKARLRGFRSGGFTSGGLVDRDSYNVDVIPRSGMNLTVNVNIAGNADDPEAIVDAVDRGVRKAFKRSRI